MSRIVRRVAAVLAAALLCLLGAAGTAPAHGFTSTVYAHVTRGEDDRLRVGVEVEYDLLVVSAADAEHDDSLFRSGTAAFDAGDAAAQKAALEAHRRSVLAYVTDRLAVTAQGGSCEPSPSGPFTMGRREGVPYTGLTLEWSCPRESDGHEFRATLFPDSEGYVKGVKTIVTYDVDGRSGSAALDGTHPSFSIEQPWTARFWEFFRLGAEHLLTGIDHILFLLALIAGSRRPREVVLAATAFTLAHSVTFLLAALGAVDVPSAVVEPVIALSISVVAGWHLWRLRRGGEMAAEVDVSGPLRLGLDRAGWTRLAVVFCFGLVHGLGFAGALGIRQAWSWTLLWSLLVFNVGIEAVQLGIIALVFPALVLLRRRAPRAGLWTTGAIAAGVALMGLVWFVQRVSGL